MPVFNADPYLASAISSILEQSYTHFEFVIINDGSTDKSGSIINSYSDPRIVCLTNPGNKGLVYSLNYGLEHARGEFIARMDADDIALPGRLKAQLEFLEVNPDYGMCGTFYEIMNSQGDSLYQVDLPESDRDLKTYLNFGNCFCHSTVMFRAELSKNIQYEEKYFLTEDYLLWYRFSKLSRIAILPVSTLRYRVHDNNISSVKKDQMLFRLKEMNEIILNDLKISFTPEELDLHTNFLVFNDRFFQERKTMKALESWLMKVLNSMQNDDRFNNRIIAKIFLRRWFVICIKTKNLKSLFFTPLFLRFRWKYIHLFLEKARDSYAKKNLGIDF